MSKHEWESKSNVTIPLEYFDELRHSYKRHIALISEIENCFWWDGENGRSIVDIDKLIEVVFPTTEAYFEGYGVIEDVYYDNINQEKVSLGAIEELEQAKQRREREEQELREWSANLPY